MANKKLFKSVKKSVAVAPKADTVNSAGGVAYSRSSEAALAQFAATGMFKNTYYVKAQDQLDEVLKLAKEVSPEFLAKVAVYSRHNAYLKDMPAFLLGVLATRDIELFKKVFPRVVDNGLMLRNFVQVIRSGRVGRKSLGTALKKAVQSWFDRSTEEYIFKASVGNDPSLADVIKMVHPKPQNKTREALYAYIIGKNYDEAFLPEIVKVFEAFKKATPGNRTVPDVPFQMLTSLNLTDKEWKEVARNAKWQMTRMNLNTFERHGVLKDPKMVKLLANRLGDVSEVKKARQYPYQIYTALKNQKSGEMEITVALYKALEASLSNVPVFNGTTAVLVDSSGSMGCAVSDSVTCNEVASLFASAIIRVNTNSYVYRFDTSASRVDVNPMDSMATNTRKIQLLGGGTDVSCGLRQLMNDFQNNKLPDNVVIVSDNASWMNSLYGYATRSMTEWLKYKQRNPKAKLVLIDIVPSSTTQVKDDKDILNVGGFNDTVFDVVANFLQNDGSPDFWANKIANDITL